MPFTIRPARAGAPAARADGIELPGDGFATRDAAAEHLYAVARSRPEVVVSHYRIVATHPGAAVTLGPLPGAELLEQLRPPAKPARMSKRAYADLWDSTPHRIEVTDELGRPVARYTVAGRLSAGPVIAQSWSAHTVRVWPAC